MKTGRNDPCPCGSGKKYKKCCGFERPPDPELLKFDAMTGTLLDEYMHLFKILGVYGQGQRQFSTYKKELNEAYRDFEQKFHPGKDDGIKDSVFMSWFYLDLRYGKDQKTIIERLLEENPAKGLIPQGTILFNHLSDSYCAMYCLMEKTRQYLIFEDIMTGKKYNVVRLNEPYEEDAREGEIWYTRLVGEPQEAVTFTTPYVFNSETRKYFEKIIEEQLQSTKRQINITGMSEEDIYRYLCKVNIYFWAMYLTQPGERPGVSKLVSTPVTRNTDNEPLRFCEIFFSMSDAGAVSAALSGFTDFEYDKEQIMWRWIKKSKNKLLGDVICLGYVWLDGDQSLVAETNSLPRALRLKKLLMQRLGNYLTYESIEVKDMASMPPVRPEEMAEFEKKQKEINDNPLLKAEMERRMNEYYFKSWVRQRIPALGGQTPYEAAKTAQGKKILQDLIVGMERMDQVNSSLGKLTIDWQGLRKHLGL